MKLENIFYIVGVIFIISAVIYFAKEFILELPDLVKLILLVIATIAAFITGELFRGKDK